MTGGRLGVSVPAGVLQARMPIPVAFPEEYALTAVVERRSGTCEAFLVMSSGGRRFAVSFDADRGDCGGVELVDGRRAGPTTGAHRGHLPHPGKPVEPCVTVRRGSISLTADGKAIGGFTGDLGRLSSLAKLDVPGGTGLVVGSWQDEFVFHRLELTPLAAPGAAPGAAPKPATPTAKAAVKGEAVTPQGWGAAALAAEPTAQNR